MATRRDGLLDDKAPPPPPPGSCAQAGREDAGREAGRGPRTAFAARYGRPGFPLAAEYGAGPAGRRFRWLVPVESVDYAAYVPVLVDGLRERPAPHGACAAHALWDLLARDHGGGGGRVLAALPRSVFPLRRVLDAGPRDWTAVVRGLLTLQRLAAAGPAVARAMVPYYRHLLPPLGRYRGGRATATDGLRANVAYDVGDLCAETLARLERAGGPCAYANIKYAIPTYESTARGGRRCCDDDDGEDRRPEDDRATRIVAPTPSLCSGLDGGGVFDLTSVI